MAYKKKKKGPGRPPKARRGRPPGSKTKKAKAPKPQADEATFQSVALGILVRIAKAIEAAIPIAKPASVAAATRVVGAQAAPIAADTQEGAIDA